MSAIQTPLIPVQIHQNQQLFSDYYLNEILPKRADWKLLAHDAAPVMQAIAQIYAKYTPSTIEAQTENDLIKPILDTLGLIFEVQPSLTTADGLKRPDYVFYRDESAKIMNKNTTLNEKLLRSSRALAVGDAKYWDRPLDVAIRRAGNDSLSNKNPSYQIAFYVQQSGLEWGILTNGRLWRLYHKDTAHKLDRFYQVDLPEILALHDAEKFLYFYAFFHRSAFDAHDLSISSLLRASTDYAQGISEHLKEQVYTALKHLAQGFLDYVPNGLNPDTETLKTIYDHSLIVLYRLLFILYAEARELLPLRESERYRATYSLEAIKRSVVRDLYTGVRLLPDSDMNWSRLRSLFRIINLGNPTLKVATFNGGLFDPLRYPFLEQKSVGDARLQQAIALLTQVNGQFIDYRDLAERHLGTIYEGLLEYHLEPMLPHEEWTIDLLNDKGERKATGSYYTPDHIVKDIVAQAVGPVLQQAIEGLTDDTAKIYAVLAVNILDPAMGSGHFLTEATEYIARFLVDLAVLPGEDTHGETDLAYWKRRVAQSCVYGVDLNPLAVDLAKLSLWLVTVAQDRPLSFLDHHLRVGNALMGSRISDLRVDSSGAGAKRVNKRSKTPEGQLPMFDEEDFREDMRTAVVSMLEIEGSASVTIDDVRAQEHAYEKLREKLYGKYGRLANLVTATYFGLALDQSFWVPLADYATGRTMAAPKKLTDLIDEAGAIARQRQFFHWELEFPEVFFDSEGKSLGDKAGFEAVVGNPPWGGEIDQPTYEYLKHKFKEIHQRLPDTAKYFFGVAHQNLKHKGNIGQILPNVVLYAHEYTKTREFLLNNYEIREVINLGDGVFQGVTAPCCMINANRTIPSPLNEINIWDVRNIPRSELPFWRNQPFITVKQDVIGDIPGCIFVGDAVGFKLLLNLYSVSDKVRDLAKNISLGVHSGCNDAFVLTRDQIKDKKIEKEILWDLLTGSDIGRYITTKTPPQLILYIEWNSSLSSCPNTLKHLDDFKEKLYSRREAEQGKMPWYALHWPRNRRLYTSPKVMCRQTADTLIATVDVYSHCALNTTIIIRPDSSDWSPFFWCALLNSKILQFAYRLLSQEEDRTFAEVKPVNLRKLPVRRISFTTSIIERSDLVQSGITLN